MFARVRGLSVALPDGSIALAQAGGCRHGDPRSWLRAVDLDEQLGAPDRNVVALSSGQAQRVAVTRVLAAGRKLIVMDEPSVGRQKKLPGLEAAVERHSCWPSDLPLPRVVLVPCLAWTCSLRSTRSAKR